MVVPAAEALVDPKPPKNPEAFEPVALVPAVDPNPKSGLLLSPPVVELVFLFGVAKDGKGEGLLPPPAAPVSVPPALPKAKFGAVEVLKGLEGADVAVADPNKPDPAEVAEVVEAPEPKSVPPVALFAPGKSGLPPEVPVLANKFPPPLVEGEANEKLGADILGGRSAIMMECAFSKRDHQRILQYWAPTIWFVAQSGTRGRAMMQLPNFAECLRSKSNLPLDKLYY